MVIIDKYLNLQALKKLEDFEKDIFMNMYENLLDIYKNAKDDSTSDYYDPLIYMKNLDDTKFIESIDDDHASRLKVNNLSLFLHYYRNLIENNILVDKRDLHIDKVLEE